jgi:hypothetical protein
MDLYEHILQDVVCIGIVPHAPLDKAVKPISRFVPEQRDGIGGFMEHDSTLLL